VQNVEGKKDGLSRTFLTSLGEGERGTDDLEFSTLSNSGDLGRGKRGLVGCIISPLETLSRAVAGGLT
jgi:hypothetical protein